MSQITKYVITCWILAIIYSILLKTFNLSIGWFLLIAIVLNFTTAFFAYPVFFPKSKEDKYANTKK